MVSTALKNISQNGNLTQIGAGVNINKYLKPPTSNILKPDIFLILQSRLQACGLHLQELVHLRLRINRVKQQKTNKTGRVPHQGWPWKPVETIWKATNKTWKYPIHGVLPGASSGKCFPWPEDSLPLAILCPHVSNGLRGLWQVCRATSQIAIFIVVHALPSERARMARGWFGKCLHTWFVGLRHVWYPEWLTFGYWNFIWQSRQKMTKGQSMDVTLPLANVRKGRLLLKPSSLSLWQCFSLNPLSYDRDAQCEVHIQICSNPSPRKTYDFLVFTHRWPPLDILHFLHPGPLWRSNGIPAPEPIANRIPAPKLIADQASKGQWPRLPVIIHTNLPSRGVDRCWVLFRQIEALGWVDLGGGHPTEFSNHLGFP